MTDHAALRDLIAPLRQALYAGTELRAALHDLFTADAVMHVCHPFGDFAGPDAYHDTVLVPLRAAMPDLERRDWIVMAGPDQDGADWIGVGGTFIGTFLHPFLDIPPTGHLAHMRFHEYYRIEQGRAVELQVIWDIPELMMQAGAWPMAPSLGREFCIPGPATQDGLRQGPYDADASLHARNRVVDMLTAMTRHPREPAEAMQMPEFWHPMMNWYGPAGIGSGRGIAGFRNWHQIPFLSAMPDRGQFPDETNHHFFADGPYVAVTGWPDMMQTISGSGWLGIAPAGQKISMRSLDFWRVDGDVIRENWVLVDILDAMAQIGVDVLARMREFNKARPTGPIPIAQDYSS